MRNSGAMPTPLPAAPLPETTPAPLVARGLMRLRRGDRLALAGGILVLLVIITALMVPLLPLADPENPDYDTGLSAPSISHPLGTDLHGRDQLSRLLWASRTSLAVGITATMIALTIGIALGGMAGFGGRYADSAAMRVADAFLSFPVILGAIAFMAVFGPGISNVFIAIAFFSWPVFARVFRASVLSVREREYVLAAHGLGGGAFHIFRRHILPNAVTPLISYAAVSVAGAILIESGLSFISLGVQRPHPSWGLMLGDAMGQFDAAPWLILAPGIAIIVATMAFFLLGAGASRLSDPRRGREAGA